MEADRLRGAAAELARARAEMHTRWAAVHSERALAFEARAEHDTVRAAQHEAAARDRELVARAAEQRVDAAEHRARIETLRAEDAGLSQAERQERIRLRSAHDLDRERHHLRRFRPGLGSSFYSPGMIGTAGTASRLAAKALQDLDREIGAIAEALQRHGPLELEELKRIVGGRYWGPGRFRAALREAVDEGLAKRRSRTIFAPPADSGAPAQEPTIGQVEEGAYAPQHHEH